MAELEVRQEDGVAILTLNRPEARNALNAGLVDALIAALQAADADPDVRVIVLTASGDKAFCSGADLAAWGAGAGALAGHYDRRRYLDLIESIWDLGTPVIAAVNGLALAAGLGLVLACDMAIAADTATFGTPEVRVGLMPMMVMALLQRHVGHKRALELIYTGDRINAATAERWGMVNRVVPLEELAAAACEQARRLAAFSPATLRLGRDAYHAAADMEFRQALHHLHAMLSVAVTTADAVEGVTAFLENRTPEWKGR